MPLNKRPRTFENEDAYDAATRALMAVGYGRLTLDAIAQELGCSAPALSKRFGSKRRLIEGYLEWTMDGIRERFRMTRMNHASPLAALRARYLLPEERPEEFGPFVRWTEVFSDPELAPTINRLRQLWEEEATISLRDALAAGELADCDVEEVARTLVAALTGVTLFYASDRDVLRDRIAATFDAVLDVYRASAVAAEQTIPG